MPDLPLWWPDISQQTAEQLGAENNSNTNFMLWYSANRRYERETAGIVVNGIAIPTDRETQAKLTGAAVMAQVNPSFVTQWKISDETFVPLNATAIVSTAQAVAAHVAACFAAEQQLLAGITANPPTVTSVDQINSAYAAITS